MHWHNFHVSTDVFAMFTANRVPLADEYCDGRWGRQLIGKRILKSCAHLRLVCAHLGYPPASCRKMRRKFPQRCTLPPFSQNARFRGTRTSVHRSASKSCNDYFPRWLQRNENVGPQASWTHRGVGRACRRSPTPLVEFHLQGVRQAPPILFVYILTFSTHCLEAALPPKTPPCEGWANAGLSTVHPNS